MCNKIALLFILGVRGKYFLKLVFNVNLNALLN